MSENSQETHLTACHECDLLLHLPHGSTNTRTRCPRCGYTLVVHHKDGLIAPFCASMAALILFLPANFFPLMAIRIGELRQDATIWEGISLMWAEEFYWVSFMVLLTAILVPAIELTLLFVVSLLALLRRGRRTMIFSLKWLQRLTDWGMLEVYMIAILVSIVKLVDLADLITDLGLYFFSGLLLMTTYAFSKFDPHQVWEVIDEMDKRPR